MFNRLCFRLKRICNGSGFYASTQSINEYDLLANLTNKTDSELSEVGYTSEDIYLIRNLDESYANHIRKYATLSTSELKNLGYTEEQISIFRVFNDSEEQIRALAASMNFTLSIDYVTWSQSNNRTNASLRYYFTWVGIPLIKTNDIVAVSWNDWTINSSASYVTYRSNSGIGDDYTLAATYVPNNGPRSFGGGYKFPMTQDDHSYWARSGYAIFTLYHKYIRADLSAYAEYGHSSVSASPSFSIPGYGSIEFSIGTDMYRQDWADMECQN